MTYLSEHGRRIAAALVAAGYGGQRDRQALALAEEVGEFVGAWRRYTGQARRTDTYDHVREELADVVITAYVLAAEHLLDLDDAIERKLEKIYSRGWREETTVAKGGDSG